MSPVPPGDQCPGSWFPTGTHISFAGLISGLSVPGAALPLSIWCPEAGVLHCWAGTSRAARVAMLGVSQSESSGPSVPMAPGPGVLPPASPMWAASEGQTPGGSFWTSPGGRGSSSGGEALSLSLSCLLARLFLPPAPRGQHPGGPGEASLPLRTHFPAWKL